MKMKHMSKAALRKAIRKLRETVCPPVSKMSHSDMAAHLQYLSRAKDAIETKKKIIPMAEKEKKAAVKKAAKKIVHDMDDAFGSAPMLPVNISDEESAAITAKWLASLVDKGIIPDTKPVRTFKAPTKPSGAAAILAEVEAEVAAKHAAKPKKAAKAAPKAEKGKRAPSAYAQFVKQYMAAHKGEKAPKELMKDAAAAFKAQK